MSCKLHPHSHLKLNWCLLGQRQRHNQSSKMAPQSHCQTLTSVTNPLTKRGKDGRIGRNTSSLTLSGRNVLWISGSLTMGMLENLTLSRAWKRMLGRLRGVAAPVEDLGSIPNNHGSSQSFSIPVPENLMPSPYLHSHIHGTHTTCMQAKHSYT